MDAADRSRAVEALRRLGCSWAGIAETFGTSRAQVRSWVEPPRDRRDRRRAKQPPDYLARARRILAARHRDELEQIAAELAEADVDEVVVLRALNGERITATPAERRIVADRWRASGRSLADLDRIQGWNIFRDLRRAS
jgi:transposase